MTTTSQKIEASKDGFFDNSSELFLKAGMFFAGIGVLGPIIGPYGIGLTDKNILDSSVMHVTGTLSSVPAAGGLAWADGVNGAVDAATGLPPVEITGPSTAQVNFWSPAGTERLAWVAVNAALPLLVFAGLLIMYRMVRSSRDSTPFSAENGRRMWQLALLVAIGGTVVTLASSLFEVWMINNSAASQLFNLNATFNFVPAYIGVLIAVVASMWSRATAVESVQPQIA